MKFALVFLALPLLTAAQQLPGLENVSVKGVDYSGNGCPLQTVSSSISPDKTTLTFSFDEFKLAIGPGFNPTDKTKSCLVRVNLNLNNTQQTNLRFAVVGATYHGFANLGVGINKLFYSTYYFANVDSFNSNTDATIPGPDSDYSAGQVFTETRTIPEASQFKSPCYVSSIILAVNTRISLVSKFASAYHNEYEDENVPLTHQVNLK